MAMESRKLTTWQPEKANRVFAALRNIGWSVKRHPDHAYYVLEREDWPDYIWPFRDDEVIGVCGLKRIASKTGLQPQDLIN
jgi:hypothetical protein